MKSRTKRIIVSAVFACMILMVWCDQLLAGKLWVNPANSGTEDGFGKSSGYRSLWGAIKNMKAGDTIIVANGDWRNLGHEMSILALGGGKHFPPSGTGFSNMTTIRAEKDWEVFLPKLDDQGVGREYMRIQGIIFTEFCNLNRWHKSKIVRCGFLGPKKTGNVSAFALAYCKGTLVEECIAWGGGRYKFLNYRGEHNIFRRCVARHDWYVADTTTACQESNFRGYGSKNSFWQNCISIDSDRLEYQTPKGLSYEDGDFWIGDQTGAGGNAVIGCLIVKGMYNAFALGGPWGKGDPKAVLLKDSVALGPSLEGLKGLTGAITYGTLSVTVRNCLFVDFDEPKQHFISHNKDIGSLLLVDSIARDVGIIKDVRSRFNCFYNVKFNDYGKNPIVKDPFKIGLLYPCRIETGSLLSSAGSGGGICGPTVLKIIGVSGASYGEPGWDKVTTENLWPFPNEKKIRELMRETVEGVTGKYGFCVDGETLTNYIWGYLGNTVPPFNLKAITGNGSVTLTWDPPAEIARATVTGYNVYSLSGNTKTLQGSTVNGNMNTSKTIAGLQNGNTYEYAVTALDRQKGESGLSYRVRVVPGKSNVVLANGKSAAITAQSKPETVDSLMNNKAFSNRFGMDFVLIRPGTFTMGILDDPKSRSHSVSVPRPFFLQKCEVSQGQWEKIMGRNPSFYTDCGDDCPVEQVSWDEVQQFIKKLNRLDGAGKYRLPTEVEWEYACRAGTSTPFAFGNCLSSEQANYNGNHPFKECVKVASLEKPAPVTAFKPNAWGLKGMHGNVWEWCSDWLGDYPAGNVTDPKGPPKGTLRVIRGGGWNSYAEACRSGNRSGVKPDDRYANLGFRLVREP